MLLDQKAVSATVNLVAETAKQMLHLSLKAAEIYPDTLQQNMYGSDIWHLATAAAVAGNNLCSLAERTMNIRSKGMSSRQRVAWWRAKTLIPIYLENIWNPCLRRMSLV